MFWIYRDQNQSALNGLYYWELGINWGLLNSSTLLGIPGNTPANAAFFEGSFNYIPSEQNVLSRIAIAYGPIGLPVGAYKVADYVIAAPTSQATNMAFGDIVIQPQTQTLYGSTSTGQFFRVDLSDLNAATGLPFTIVRETGLLSVQTSTWDDYERSSTPERSRSI